MEVAAAWIEEEGKVLLAKRRSDDELGGFWEFPGGGLEEGEDLRDCLRRELQEELGITVEVGEEVASVVHDHEGRAIHLHLLQARIVQGQPQPLGCAAVQWVPIQDLKEFDLAPADRRLLERSFAPPHPRSAAQTLSEPIGGPKDRTWSPNK